MQKLILAPIVIFFALLSGEIVFVPTHAYAACCMCGTCGSRCTCPGASDACPYCAAPESNAFQAKNTGATVLSIRGIRESLLSFLPKSDDTQQITKIGGTAQCTRYNFRLKFFDADALLKFATAFLEDMGTRDNIVAMK